MTARCRWDLAAGREQARFAGRTGVVSSVAVTADGATAVSGGWDGTVWVWDLAVGRERAKLTGHDGAVSSVAVTGDGTTAVSGGTNRSVRGGASPPEHRWPAGTETTRSSRAPQYLASPSKSA